MSNILDSKNFGSKIYERFPLKYREDDALYGSALERYIQAMSEGGFKYSLDEMNGILDLIDPIKVDSKILPFLFNQYGLNIFNGIPENYLRYLLPNIGEAWSKKGSLSVVEFVTSSLSGVKTSTETEYDEFNNPTISVKLEMDYAIGDYFPDAGQFSRLLENFIPFYCDSRLIYSYIFFESQVLNPKDSEVLKRITDNKLDSGEFNVVEDLLVQDIKQKLDDKGSIKPFEYNTYKITPKSLTETSTFKGKEDSFVRGKSYYNEFSMFQLRRASDKVEESEKNSVFGEGIFGRAVLGVGGDYVDTIEDNVTSSVIEVAGINMLSDNSLTNNTNNTLNTSFMTNGLSSYDIITKGTSIEIVF